MAIEHMPININFYFSFDLKIILLHWQFSLDWSKLLLMGGTRMPTLKLHKFPIT